MSLSKRFLLLLYVWPSVAFAQGWGNLNLSARGVSRLVNKKMASLVTGPANGTMVSSFASFDPADGSFVFKGSAALTGEADSNRFAFLSLRLEGDLISDSYAVLFKNSALNSGATADLQLHYRFRKGLRKYYAFATDESKLMRDKTLLGIWRKQALAEASTAYAASHFTEVLARYRFQKSVLEFRAKANTQAQVQKITELKAELAKVAPNDSTVKALSNDVATLEKNASDFGKQLQDLQYKTDSVTIIQSDYLGFWADANNQINKKYRDSLDTIENNVSLAGIRFTWVTLILGASQKGYYTFDAAGPFQSQLVKQDLKTFRVGLSFNYYSEQTFPSSVFYGNLGFVFYKDNNIRFLDTKQLVQERTLQNDAEDTVRKIAKTYTVYTDTIRQTHVISLFSNLYFMNNARTLALHLFPSFDLIRSEKDIANLGIGLVTSFKNEKKEKPIVNIEGYVKLNDLLNNHEEKSDFWNKNELGVSFSIPINFFK